MIVTSGEEPVRAIRYTPETCINTGSRYLNPIAAGRVETLYCKTSTTNFVYSTTVRTCCLRERCEVWPCGAMRNFEPCDLLGVEVENIYFNFGDKYWRCPKHRKQESGK